MVNTTAVELGLGTGGWHFVHWNLSREAWSEPGPGHVMKLRYTSLQVDTGAAEEDRGADLPDDLGGMPVVACTLHSQVACVAAGFHHGRPGTPRLRDDRLRRPARWPCPTWWPGCGSDGRLAATVTCGHAFGGDFEAVTLASALRWRPARPARRRSSGARARRRRHRQRFGFGGLEAATCSTRPPGWADGRRGRALLRADPRARHQGVSHHTSTALEWLPHPPAVAVPAGEPVPDGAVACSCGRPGRSAA